MEGSKDDHRTDAARSSGGKPPKSGLDEPLAVSVSKQGRRLVRQNDDGHISAPLTEDQGYGRFGNSSSYTERAAATPSSVASCQRRPNSGIGFPMPRWPAAPISTQ